MRNKLKKNKRSSNFNFIFVSLSFSTSEQAELRKLPKLKLEFASAKKSTKVS